MRSVLQNCRGVPFKGPSGLGGSRLKGPSKDPTLEPLGLALGPPKMALAIHFGHRFEFSLTLAPLGLDFGSPGMPQELCWRHKLVPRLIKVYFAAPSFYYALVGGIWRTIGSSLDHTFNNLFICMSVHLVCCPSQRTHCCISKISKYTSLETRVSRTRLKVVD